ncbi:virion structural protein [Streptomyces phage Lilbooboo]|uniref:Minor tail protein n=1 Tax=Streptomyces phage Lilbooboo TaxID=2510571 RepID=A0A411B303_9CAUD|nr:virion structural protein [Streptomyces phage Lilbooboo]QAX94714.1 minor tail protein [Streptomyces phage Lilbooboo]
MSSFAWFQDGVGYGGSDLANWQSLMVPRGSLKHLFSSTTQFLANSNQTNRTVAIGAGNVFIGGTSSGGTWAWSDGGTLSVPTASNDNPRKDLIVARLTTAAADGANGLAIELIQGTPAASPAVPTRPDNAVALCIVDQPKASTTFSITVVRHTGQYGDQATLANGAVAIDWAGVLPSASAFPTGFTLYDLGTNQRWVRKNDQTWFTSDPGPWKSCTLQNVQAKDGTNVTVTGSLYVRESSNGWELSGQLNFSPSKDFDQLVTPALLPAGITRPTQNTYGSSGQSWANTTSGVARLALMTNGSVEFGNDGTAGTAYVNEQFSKSPWNS